MCIHDFTCILLSVTMKDVKSTVQDVDTKGNPVVLTAFSCWRFFNSITHLKKLEFILAVTIVLSLCRVMIALICKKYLCICWHGKLCKSRVWYCNLAQLILFWNFFILWLIYLCQTTLNYTKAGIPNLPLIICSKRSFSWWNRNVLREWIYRHDRRITDERLNSD